MTPLGDMDDEEERELARKWDERRAAEKKKGGNRKRRNAAPPTTKAPCVACSGRGTVRAYDVEAMAAERRLRGLTQEALAKLAGWTPSQVSMLETGSRPMTAKSAARYWKALQAAGKGCGA